MSELLRIRVCVLDHRVIEDEDGNAIADVHGHGEHGARAVSERIVECVSALSGVPYPSAAVRGAVEALERIAEPGCDDQDPETVKWTCLDRYPESPEDWCAPCIARAALSSLRPSEEKQ